MNDLARMLKLVVDHPSFNYGIIAVIGFSSILLGLETVDAIALEYGTFITWSHHVVLGIFIVEAVMKILAEYPKPQNYFQDGWNVFDFLIIVFCLIPATGEFALIARTLRILRILSVIPELRVLITVLLRSLPSMFNIVLLTLLIFYVYGIVGHHLFAETDPKHWESLGVSLLSLFRVITLEGWTEMMDTTMAQHWWAWMFFVSLVLVGTFVVFNLIIAVVIQNHELAVKHMDRLGLSAPSTHQLLEEIQGMRETLADLTAQLERHSSPDAGESTS